MKFNRTILSVCLPLLSSAAFGQTAPMAPAQVAPKPAVTPAPAAAQGSTPVVAGPPGTAANNGQIVASQRSANLTNNRKVTLGVTSNAQQQAVNQTVGAKTAAATQAITAQQQNLAFNPVLNGRATNTGSALQQNGSSVVSGVFVPGTTSPSTNIFVSTNIFTPGTGTSSTVGTNSTNSAVAATRAVKAK